MTDPRFKVATSSAPTMAPDRVIIPAGLDSFGAVFRTDKGAQMVARAGPLALGSVLCLLSWAQLASGQEGQALPRPPLPEISAEYPFEPHYVNVLGSRLHYVDEGAGSPILMLHGNPTSSYLWRNVIPHLTTRGRVLALDLIGMGKSDQPDIDYTYADHIGYVQGFIEALELRDLILVVHDWGSALGFDYASRHEDNVRGIAFMEAIGPPGLPAASYEAMGGGGEFFRRLRTSGEGERLILEENYFVEQVLPSSVVRGLGQEEMAFYRAPYPTPQSRKPTLVWPREIPIGGEPENTVRMVTTYSKWLQQTRVPMLHFYAKPGALNPPEVAEWYVQHLKNIESLYVGPGFHYIQEDHPEVIGRAIADWLRRLPQGGE